MITVNYYEQIQGNWIGDLEKKRKGPCACERVKSPLFSVSMHTVTKVNSPLFPRLFRNCNGCWLSEGDYHRDLFLSRSEERV